MMTAKQFDVPLLFNAPKSSAHWNYVTRIYDRAVKLQAAGYWFDCITAETLQVVTPNETRYVVTMPEFDPFADAEDVWKCSCDGFAKDKDCKHRIAVALHKAGMEEKEGIERVQLMQLDLMDAQARDAETADGCDYPDY